MGGGITIRAPQWVPINQSGPRLPNRVILRFREWQKQYILVYFTQIKLYYTCLPLRLGAFIATLALFGTLTPTCSPDSPSLALSSRGYLIATLFFALSDTLPAF